MNEEFQGFMKNLQCNLCQNSIFIKMYQIPDLLLDAREILTNYVKCQNCGLIFQNPQLTQPELEKHYPTHYLPFQPFPTTDTKSFFGKLSFRWGLHQRYKLLKRYKKKGRLLDVGCGIGTYLNKIKCDADFELQGIEINNHAAVKARELYDLNIFNGTLEEAEFQANFFDAVTLWDVLEHIHDPFGTLQNINRILKTNGILVLRLPNFNSWQARIFSSNWSGFDAPRHLFVFTPDLIKLYLEKNNFKLLHLSTYLGGYSTFILSFNFWLNRRRTNTQINKILISMLRHPLIRFILFPFFRIPGLLGKGSVMTVVAQKMDLY